MQGHSQYDEQIKIIAEYKRNIQNIMQQTQYSTPLYWHKNICWIRHSHSIVLYAKALIARYTHKDITYHWRTNEVTRNRIMPKPKKLLKKAIKTFRHPFKHVLHKFRANRVPLNQHLFDKKGFHTTFYSHCSDNKPQSMHPQNSKESSNNKKRKQRKHNTLRKRQKFATFLTVTHPTLPPLYQILPPKVLPPQKRRKISPIELSDTYSLLVFNQIPFPMTFFSTHRKHRWGKKGWRASGHTHSNTWNPHTIYFPLSKICRNSSWLEGKKLGSFISVVCWFGWSTLVPRHLFIRQSLVLQENAMTISEISNLGHRMPQIFFKVCYDIILHKSKSEKNIFWSFVSISSPYLFLFYQKIKLKICMKLQKYTCIFFFRLRFM